MIISAWPHVQGDRLAELSSDDARRAKLEAAAAQLEMERDRECTFKPALSSGTMRLSNQENQDPDAAVSPHRILAVSQFCMLRHCPGMRCFVTAADDLPGWLVIYFSPLSYFDMCSDTARQ